MLAPQDFDPPGDRFPSDAAIARLETALRAYVVGAGAEEPVASAFVTIAQEADARHLRAEAVLLAFKRVWSRMAEEHAFPDRERRDLAYEHLVKLCITTYFRR